MERLLKLTMISFLINFSFAVYNAYLGISYRSWWFVSLAAYYIVLSVVRFSLLRIKQKCRGDLLKEIFSMRFTGMIFMILSVCLAGITYLSFEENHGTEQNIIVVITIALYAFIKIVLAIINLIKAGRKDFYITKTLRNVSFADALVSIFSLQRTMLVTFEGLTETEVKIFNGATGTAVYLSIFLLGLNLIGGRRISMAKSKIIEINEKITENVTKSYKAIENGVVNGYKKIENGAVGGYKKIENKFVEKFLVNSFEEENIEDKNEK